MLFQNGIRHCGAARGGGGRWHAVRIECVNVPSGWKDSFTVAQQITTHCRRHPFAVQGSMHTRDLFCVHREQITNLDRFRDLVADSRRSASALQRVLRADGHG